MSHTKKNDNFKVGYGKPPTETQFKPGVSGNPRGRPKGSKNAISILQQAMAEKVIVNENGRRCKQSKFEVMCKQLANKAAAGDFRSMQLMISIAQQMDLAESVVTPDKQIDQEVAQQLVDQIFHLKK